MRITVTYVHIETDKIIAKVRSDKLWKAAAIEYHRLLEPFVPKDTRALNETVDISPKTIVYRAPYAHYQYEGRVMGPSIPISRHGNAVGFFSPRGVRKSYTGARLKHKNGGPKWDKKGEPTALPALARWMQSFIDGGGISFD